MISNLKLIAIIPARGGSKGVARKNIKPLCGKPLIYYSIKVGTESKYIDRVIVSTEDEEIAMIARRYNAEVIDRPNKLASDDAPSIPVFQHVLNYLKENEKYIPDIVIILQPTSPLRTTKDVDDSIEMLVREKCDSVITVKKCENHLEWMLKINNKGKVKKIIENKKSIRRQDAEEIYLPNGAVYVTWYDIIMKKDTLNGPDTRALIMPPDRSIDIDTKLDFFIAEQILEVKRYEIN